MKIVFCYYWIKTNNKFILLFRIAAELDDRMDDILAEKSERERDEILYQEARRLVIAEIQNIVYSEYLPLVLGRATVKRVNIDLDSGSEYNGKLDPSIMNEFATAAMRCRHSSSQLFRILIQVRSLHGLWPLQADWSQQLASKVPLF